VANGSRGTAYKLIRSLYGEGCVSGLTDGELLKRFTARQRDAAEMAFTALVERHGPDVLRTCCSILRDQHAAEDAFQATFLILVRKSRSLWVRDSLGPWLHRVACRAAGRAKTEANRRRTHEIRLYEASVKCEAGQDRTSLAAAIHEEVDRLPDRFRVPVVLCDLHGCTYEEAARRMGCSIATVKGRLKRRQERLRVRLTLRGLAPSSSLVGLGQSAKATVVPPSLASSTIKAAACVAAKGPAAAGVVSAPVAAIVKGVLTTMALMNARLGAVFASLTFAAITAATVIAAQQGQGHDDRNARMGPDRRTATKPMVPLSGATKPAPRKIGSGMTFAQIKPTLVALLNKHGSATVTTLEGIEVSVRLHNERKIDSAEALLKQVLLEGPVAIRGPADLRPDGEADVPGWPEANNMKQKARQLLSLARRQIASGDLEEADRLLAKARTLDSK
jgi:RNA polymerase sigma factor (sigma-70 family)